MHTTAIFPSLISTDAAASGPLTSNIIAFASLSSKRDSSVDAGKKQEVKNIREKIKKFINELKKDYFSQSPEEVLQTLQISLPAMEMLVELVKKFHEKFSAKKREKNLSFFIYITN